MSIGLSWWPTEFIGFLRRKIFDHYYIIAWSPSIGLWQEHTAGKTTVPAFHKRLL